VPIESGTYKITNVQSGQALHLFEGDNKSVVASSIVDSDRQLWIPVPVTSGGWTVRSVLTEQSIGFEGVLQEGTYIIVGDSNVAKPWIF